MRTTCLFVATSMLLGCGRSGSANKAEPEANSQRFDARRPMQPHFHEVPALLGATRLWVAPNGAWIAGQLPIEAEMGKDPITLLDRARYRLVDDHGQVVDEQPGIVLAHPNDEGKVCRVLPGPKIVPPWDSPTEIAIPTRADSSLQYLFATNDCRQFLAVLQEEKPDPKTGIGDSRLVYFDAVGAEHWDGTISYLTAVALSGDGGTVVVTSGAYHGFTFIDGETGDIRWRSGKPGSWRDAAKVLRFADEGHQVIGANWNALFFLDEDKKKVRVIKPWPHAAITDMAFCDDKLAALSYRELGGDSGGRLGFSSPGDMRSELYLIDPASGTDSEVVDPRIQRDGVAAIACQAGKLVLAIQK